MDTMQLNSEIRDQTGKGAARRLRSAGKLPAILYGAKTDPIMLAMDHSELKKTLKGRAAENIIFDLTINGGKKSQSKKVMIKELQRDPVKRDYLHVDLFEISMAKELEVEIPLDLLNTPIGVEQGGILQHIRREVKAACLPQDLVDKIEVDVSGLDIGQSLHIRDISFPPGLRSLDDEDLAFVTVVAPTVAAEVEEEEVEEVEEAEVEETEGEEVSSEEES
ncbi:MAG: 50S ribosomal protein L25/general stress protein Ctc [Deltaproteobacteria bacterium]|nr:MAG: 50S ribosomal protein L25/general stress protein Ctc [Deltaproteobacteria bacterium]